MARTTAQVVKRYKAPPDNPTQTAPKTLQEGTLDQAAVDKIYENEGTIKNGNTVGTGGQAKVRKVKMKSGKTYMQRKLFRLKTKQN